MPRTPLQGLAFLLGFALALWLGPATIAVEPVADPEAAQLEASLAAQVNAIRAQHHLVPLVRREDLDGVARAHSGDMAARGYFAHESPEGLNPLHRLERAQLDGFSMAAENLGTTTRPSPASEIVTGWMRSTDHRTNILAPAFNATGLGVARGRDGSWIATQVFVTYPR